tara:strand:+ start:530 stop:973 length:444 start_codon:yes stop_codon:yes gene_type:complete
MEEGVNVVEADGDGDDVAAAAAEEDDDDDELVTAVDNGEAVVDAVCATVEIGAGEVEPRDCRLMALAEGRDDVADTTRTNWSASSPVFCFLLPLSSAEEERFLLLVGTLKTPPFCEDDADVEAVEGERGVLATVVVLEEEAKEASSS